MADRQNLPVIASAVVSDVCALFSKQGGILGTAIQILLEERLASARDILLEEIAAGEILPPDSIGRDDTVAAVYRYYRAAQEGAARINLRLLAQCIAGRVVHSKLRADEFLYYAEIIASLRRNEIILLASAIRHHADYERERIAQGLTEFDADGKLVSVHRRVVQELRQDYSFTSATEITAFAVALQRTGLIFVETVMDGLRMKPSPQLEDLHRLVNIEAALNKETAGP